MIADEHLYLRLVSLQQTVIQFESSYISVSAVSFFDKKEKSSQF